MSKNIATLFSICIIATELFTGCNAKPSPKQETATERPAVAVNAPTTKDAKIKEAKVSEKKGNQLSKTESTVHNVPLTVVVDNLESSSAPVVMGVYGTSNTFLDTKDQLKEYRFKPKKGKLVATINDLKYGEFAMAIYQDVNSDGKINKSVIGMPQEPYAFSNNYKPVIKAPTFENCKFAYNAHENTIRITLIK